MWIRRRGHVYEDEVTGIPIDPCPAYSTRRIFADREERGQVTLLLYVLDDARFETRFRAYWAITTVSNHDELRNEKVPISSF